MKLMTMIALSILGTSLSQAAVLPGLMKISPQLQKKISEADRLVMIDLANVKIPALILLKSQADLSKIDESLSKNEKGLQVYKALTEVALATQDEIISILKTENVKYQSFYITNMVAVYDAPASLLKKLAARADVSRVFENTKIAMDLPSRHALSLTGGDNKTVLDNLTYIGADKVWNNLGVKGEGIVVASQDTGVDLKHTMLMKKYRGYKADGTFDHSHNWHDSITTVNGGSSFNKCGLATTAPCDDDQHGTHTVGTMLGSNETQTIGVAPEAKWVGCRNMDEGAGTPATYIDCFEWLLAPYNKGENPMVDADPLQAPDVINNSWGCPQEEGCVGDEIKSAIVAMEKAGIMVVASAGNEGNGCKTIGSQPATVTDFVLSIGAYDHRSKRIASFSSRGPSTLDGKIGPNVVAPGVNIKSSVPGGGYASFSGTSMAGPHVAGLVALMWSANPKLVGHVDATRKIIMSTAKPLRSNENCGGISGQSVPNNTFGYGEIDAFQAVSKAKEF